NEKAEGGGPPFSERCHDFFDGGLGRQFDLRPRKAEPLGAQSHLRYRFLARNVNRAMAAAGERGRDLDQQRRLADAGIAAEQQYRAAHKTAAGHAIEFGEPRRKARRVVSRAPERFERKEPPLAWGASGQLYGGTLLGDRIPFAAGVALALPAAIGRPAVLADEVRFATGHDAALLHGLVRIPCALKAVPVACLGRAAMLAQK